MKMESDSMNTKSIRVLIDNNVNQNEAKKIVDNLSYSQQLVFMLVYQQNLSVREIASLVDKSVSTIYRKLNTVNYHLTKALNPKKFRKAQDILYGERATSSVS